MNLSHLASGGMVYRGDYDAGTTYFRNNTVKHEDDIYICTAQTTGNAPTVETYWAMIAEAPDVSVANTGSGTKPASFTLTSDGSTITLNKPS